MLPVRYVVPANIELQAEQRRFVAVPFDGPLRSSTVRPGDLVNEGDLLAEIDPRELEYELSGVNAELEKALQEKKAKMVERNVAGSQMAELDSQRLRSEADLLMLRRQNLEIRSPITGVIVRGDLERSWGMPMMRGDTLFEVAPLEVMQVEIAIPEREIRHVRTGMTVDFSVDALPDRALQGTLLWIHPRAELIENENVFIARMELVNPDLLYRPGMHGRARIRSDRHPLIWNYFHKPYYALRHSLGW
jgi:multidrug efflux pump subunit AcrA (membrane-fusion protein)